MSIHTEVVDSRNLTVLTVIGQVTVDEMRRAIEGFWQSPELTLNVLWDYRQADMSRLTRAAHEELVRVGLKYRHRLPERTGGRTAIIASRDLEYGMNRVSETLAEIEDYPFQVKTFRTAEEAEAWLAEGSG